MRRQKEQSTSRRHSRFNKDDARGVFPRMLYLLPGSLGTGSRNDQERRKKQADCFHTGNIPPGYPENKLYVSHLYFW